MMPAGFLVTWPWLRIPLILLALDIVIVAVYQPGLRGPFVFDDSPHIINSPTIKISSLNLENLLIAGFSDKSELFQRPLAKMSFALNYYFSGGLDPFAFKMTNLVIHILNAGLVYWFAALLLAQYTAARTFTTQQNAHRWIPAFTAAFWALHPIQLTSVLYAVQRMNSLSAFFVLVGLILFVYGRQRISINARNGFPMMSIGLLVGMAFGTSSKENAVLLPLFVLLVEMAFFTRAGLDKGTLRKLRLFHFLSLAILFLALSWAIATGIIAKSYIGREYTLTERLLTESRILWYYCSLLILPNLRQLSLFHDDIPLSSGLLTPWTTFPALTSILLIALAALLLVKRYPIFGFSVLWFLIGHSMESSLIGLEIAHEHRNYLPSLGFFVGVTFGLYSKFDGAHKYRAIPTILGAALIVAFGGVTYLRSQTWSNEQDIITQMTYHHPLSAQAQYMMGELKGERFHDAARALRHYQKAAELAPHEVGYYIKIAVTRITAEAKSGNGTAASQNASADRPTQHSKAGSETGQELNEIISHIANDLKRNPPSSLTINILRSLARCVDETTDDCRLLQPWITNWYRALLENPQIPRHVRANFTVYLFNLATNRGDYRLALWSAETAETHDADNSNYPLMKANAYMLMDQLDKAESILYSFGDGSTLDGETLSNRAQLLSMIRDRRKTKKTRKHP